MRDYADIISQIRIAAIGVKKQSNRLTLMQDAADAIEELQEENRLLKISVELQSRIIRSMETVIKANGIQIQTKDGARMAELPKEVG